MLLTRKLARVALANPGAGTQRCQRLYAKEAEEHRCRHRCWGFAQMLEQSGILPQQLFVKALHHAGGRMFVPELHLQLEDGWEPHMFSGPMAYEGKVIS